jgi:hypothetical protein
VQVDCQHLAALAGQHGGGGSAAGDAAFLGGFFADAAVHAEPAVDAPAEPAGAGSPLECSTSEYSSEEEAADFNNIITRTSHYESSTMIGPGYNEEEERAGFVERLDHAVAWMPTAPGTVPCTRCFWRRRFLWSLEFGVFRCQFLASRCVPCGHIL